MKILAIFVTFLLAFSNAKPKEEPEGCKDCREGTTKLLQWANTPTELTQEEDLLINEVCVLFDDVGGCTAGVLTWWRKIANVIYTNPETANGICEFIDPACQRPTVRAWDCDTCKNRMKDVADALNSSTGVEDLVIALQGQAFCQSEDLSDLSEEQIRICQGFIGDFIPPAMNAITMAIVANDADICSAVYEIC